MDKRTLAGLAALVATRLVIDLRALHIDAPRYQDWEEARNAAVGWYMLHAGLWDQALTLQHKEFCGGCTVVSALAVPPLAVAGDAWLAWKAVPLGLAALGVVLAFVALDRLAGRPAAWGAALLATLAAPGLAALQRMAWGNHVEATLVALGLLALAPSERRGGRFALGLLAGLGAWMARTSLFASVVLLPWALRKGPRAPLLAGLALGALPLTLPAARGDRGRYAPWFESLPTPADALERLAALGMPGPLAARATFGEALAAAALLGAAGVGAALLRGRGRLLLALAAAYAAAFVLASPPLPPAGPGLPLLASRYHAPWLWLLALVTAGGAGAAWLRGGAWRGLAVALLAAPLAVGAWGVAREPRAPVEAHAPVVDHARFAGHLARRVDPERLARARSGHEATDDALRRARGYQLGLGVVAGALALPDAEARAGGDPLVRWALGYALVPEAPDADDLARVAGLTDPSTRAGALGALGQAEARRAARLGPAHSLSPDALVDESLAHLGPDLAPVAGAVLAMGCRAMDRHAVDQATLCLRRRLTAQDPALALGAALYVADVGWTDSEGQAALGALPPAHAEAFSAGLLLHRVPPPVPVSVEAYEGRAPPPWAAFGPLAPPGP